MDDEFELVLDELLPLEFDEVLLLEFDEEFPAVMNDPGIGSLLPGAAILPAKVVASAACTGASPMAPAATAAWVTPTSIAAANVDTVIELFVVMAITP